MPLPPPSKIVCIGRNYRAHAAEFGHDVPPEPLFFLKPPSAVIGPGEPIVVPGWVGRVDHEGEVGVVVGRRARHLRAEEALDWVAGIVPLNDVTARDLQSRDDQWSRAKGFDTFCPVGERVPPGSVELAAVSLECRVNDEIRQAASLSELVFPVPFLLEHVTRVMTLEPGDILATGTPEGVGPIHPGDVVEVELLGLSVLRNPVVAEEGKGADRPEGEGEDR